MWREYIRKFIENDRETTVNYIDNSHSEEFIAENFPHLECPNEMINECFAFRCWTLSKHIRKTPDGFVFSEFLENVGWAGKYNTINAALFHHLNECRWMKNSVFGLDYLRFFLYNKGENAYVYSTPALYEMIKFLGFTGNENLLEKMLPQMEEYIGTFDRLHRLENGLYFSKEDGYDAMELSISGRTPKGEVLPGIRPTLNAFMYGGYRALGEAFLKIGNSKKAEFYRQKADEIKRLFISACFDGDFYKAIHLPFDKLNKTVSVKDIQKGMNAREELGYIPFIYGMYNPGGEKCFELLFDDSVFHTPYGIATADKGAERYLYSADHPCLWNGYIWPYATSQTVTAFINVLEKYGGHGCITDQNLYGLIEEYSRSQRLTADGKTVPWIDESLSPVDGSWYTLKVLNSDRWKTDGVANERGKHYNHSTYIDLVLRGLIGIREDAETLTVTPHIKGIWKWFRVDNLTYHGKTYCITYDEDGSHFNGKAGLIIEETV